MEGSVNMTSEASTGELALIIGAFMVPFLIFLVIFYVIFAIFLGMIFKKAGEDSWKAWVPIYNTWTMLQLGGQKGFWAVLAIVPVVQIVSVVFMIIAAHNIGRSLGKESWFVILYILFPPVWLIWLALDQSTWQGAGNDAAAMTPPTPGFTPPVQPSDASTPDETPPIAPTQPVDTSVDSPEIPPASSPVEQPVASEEVQPTASQPEAAQPAVEAPVTPPQPEDQSPTSFQPEFQPKPFVAPDPIDTPPATPSQPNPEPPVQEPTTEPESQDDAPKPPSSPFVQ